MDITTPNPRAPSEWTDARIFGIKAMWADGLSASQIAAAIGGVSRNAVIGKLHRLGLKRDDRKARQIFTRNYQRLTRVEKAERQTARKITAVSISQARPLPITPTSEPSIRFLNITFDQLAHGDCRFPTGDSPFHYCGQPAIDSGPYCRGCFEATHKSAA